MPTEGHKSLTIRKDADEMLHDVSKESRVSKSKIATHAIKKELQPIVKLRNMQYDEKLTGEQRKLANELYKKILSAPGFPDVSTDVVNCAIEAVLKEAKG